MTTCAIVGNAQSIFDREDGDIIDQHDIVVRINSPYIKKAKCQGRKTSIIFTNRRRAMHVKALKQTRRHQYQIIILNDVCANDFERISKEIESDVGESSARPTTGFMAIYYVFGLGYDIQLFGFDWYKTPSITNMNAKRFEHLKKENGVWINHYPEWEERQIQELLGSKE